MAHSIRTLVAGVAEVDGSDPVLPVAVELAQRLDGTLHLVHTYPIPDPTLSLIGADMSGTAAAPLPLPQVDDLQSIAVSLRDALRAQVESAGGAPSVQLHVEAGPAPTQIEHVAHETGADLVLVGATHSGAVERALLGSTADQIIRHSPAPVLVLRQRVGEAAARVLLTTDLSELSVAACSFGVGLAYRLFGPTLTELRCLLVRSPAPAEVPPDALRLMDQGQEDLRRFVSRLPNTGLPVTPVLRIGAPADEIVAEAAEWPADLVVLGTHARSGLSRLILGSVAESTLHDLRCNAVVVPQSPGERD